MKILSVLSFLAVLLGVNNGFGGSLLPGTQLEFKTVTRPQDVQFARKYLIRYMEGVKLAEWDRALQAGEVEIARGDLNDDGVP